MPPRTNPTARQMRLGAELRKMREAAGVTAREAAQILGSGSAQLSHLEAGRFGVSEQRIRRLAAHYACDDAAYVDALVAMAAERGKGWWEEYRGIVAPLGPDLAELEHHAIRMHTFEMAHIPGLFQTEDHMRAAFRYMSPDWPSREVDAFVAFRSERQKVIAGGEPTPFDAVIHEAALRIRVGGRQTAVDQLKRILGLSELPHVSVRVVPFDSEDFAGAGYSMLYAEGAVAQLDTVHIDTGHGGVFVDAEPRLKQYRRRYERIGSTSLDPHTSREMIARILHEL
ncbi:transcriptional regulator [Streptomyces sulfonofaciens]|uniref:Transcriptional regulator n=1 Tax=Streptomyces sulfonofaciens TaxID=68272 RepID=A0A919G357_9ACTN|nr:helix-turn-helix transcriptional regulator [Streptomyces sulfonofaciens]GHH76290.1 transcriptional regulator [Streptomyces sulfonofaciens]